MKKHVRKTSAGYVELYISVVLFLIMALGMAMAVEYKTRQIKTEKTAWLAQTLTWEKSRNNQTLDVKDQQMIKKLQVGYRQDTPLHIQEMGLLDRADRALVSDGLVRTIATAIDLLQTYFQCPEQLEPLSFLAFKHMLYPHGQASITKEFDATFEAGVSEWMDLHAMDTHQAIYENINRGFTGTDIGETGWFLRQLLWQEAVGQSEFGYLMPLQLLGIFEFSKRIVAILAKDPGLFNIFKRKKIRKAKHLIKKDILGSVLMEKLAEQLEEYTSIEPTSRFNPKHCQQLQPTP